MDPNEKPMKPDREKKKTPHRIVPKPGRRFHEHVLISFRKLLLGPAHYSVSRSSPVGEAIKCITVSDIYLLRKTDPK